MYITDLDYNCVCTIAYQTQRILRIFRYLSLKLHDQPVQLVTQKLSMTYSILFKAILPILEILSQKARNYTSHPMVCVHNYKQYILPRYECDWISTIIIIWPGFGKHHARCHDNVWFCICVLRPSRFHCWFKWLYNSQLQTISYFLMQLGLVVHCYSS